jgi:hypothetical protein
MNKESENVLLRVAEIKENDRMAREQHKFTFFQFMKILGKVDVEVGEDNTENSDTDDKKESNGHEMQQSSNVREECNKDEIVHPVNNSTGEITHISRLHFEKSKLNDSPRLNRNIRVKRKRKVPSFEKIKLKKREDKEKQPDLNPYILFKNGIPKFEINPPLNLMQFRGVRVQPDKKVIDILAILNNYRRK